MLVGVALTTLPCAILLCFSDRHTLGAASDSLSRRALLTPLAHARVEPAPPLGEPPHEGLPRSSSVDHALSGAVGRDDEPSGAAISACAAAVDARPRLLPSPPPGRLLGSGGVRASERLIAPLVAAADTFQFFGSGMTVRFFSLFFWQKLGMHPIATNAVYAGGPIGTAVMAILMQRVSRRHGRVLTSVLCRTASVLLLIAIPLIMLFAPPIPQSPCPPSSPPSPPPPPFGDTVLGETPLATPPGARSPGRVAASTFFFSTFSASSPTPPPAAAACPPLPVLSAYDPHWLIVPIYLLRTWLNNCTSGLTKSVLNDYVSKKHRAKWNALESLNLFSWSGSSFIGGYLISAFDATPHLQQYGFDITFLITACLQACSILCLVPLLRIVPSEDALKQRPLAGPAGHEAVQPLADDAGGDSRVARVAYGAPLAAGGGVEPLLMPASVPQLQPPGSVQR